MDSFNDGMILPTLIKQLRSILERYPDDGQILKEIIQNAEDAGASKVVFLIDNSTYGRDPEKLYHEGLTQYQGPALYAYNDAVFSEDDWKGIRMLHESVKADDPMKVGRFGLGFKSVFHMTDLPSVFSGNGIGFIDPHREFFEIQLPGCRSKEKTTAYRWLLDRDKAEVDRLQDQFEPFRVELFGVSQSTFESGYFKGTIFRFPFRSKDMKSSDLSKTTYDREKVEDLVKSLRADAHHMLLFLKNLRSIEVFERNVGGEPRKLLDIQITAPYLDVVRKKCEEFQKQVSFDWRVQNPISVTFPVEYSIEDHMDAAAAAASTGKDTFLWIVSQYFGGADEGPYIKTSVDRTYLPFVGVALPLDPDGKDDPWKTNPKGHVFCFLPLPLEKKSPTGLRFHVHGSFAIDQNRRYIKWPSADLDMVRVKDTALIWNQFLVNIVLPNAVYKMIDFLIRLKVQNIPKDLQDKIQKAETENPEFVSNLVYSMMPEDAMVTTQWRGLSSKIYNITLMKLSLFHSPVSGGKWLHYEDAVFDCSRNKSTLMKLLRRILCEDGKNLVSVPEHIYNQLPENAKNISASVVCESLRNVQHHMKITDKDRKILLDYFSEKLPDPARLMELKLLPLEDGSWTTFNKPNSKEKVYICSKDHPKDLLPGMENRILKADDVAPCVKEWGTKGIFQLKHLNAEDVSELICFIFKRWSSRETIHLKIEPWLTEEWLSSLWSYLQKHFKQQNLSCFENVHLVPLGDGTIVKLSQHLPIVSKVDGYDKGSPPLNPDLIIQCRQVGIQVIENLEQGVFNHNGVWNKYILQPNGRGVLSSLQRLEKQIGIQKLVENFKVVPEKSRQRFNEFIAAWLQNGDHTLADGKLIRSLPLFCTVDGSGKQKAMRVSMEDVQLVSPQNNDLPLQSPKLLLDLSEKCAYKIGACLGVRPSLIPDLLLSTYFPAVEKGEYSINEISKLMQYVCKNLTKFEQVSDKITSQTREIRFIQTKGDSLVRPLDVYEKSDLLSRLFEEQDVFPCGEFSKPAYYQALLRLGLKTTAAITALEVLAIAEKLSNCSNSNAVNIKQSEALTELLNQHADRLLPQAISVNRIPVLLKDKLSELKWVKISSSRPDNYPPGLTFVGEQQSGNNLARPSDISASNHVYLVGSSRPVINIQGIAALAKKFGWTNEPPIDSVVQHLLSTINSYDPRHKIPIQYIVVQVYRFLNQNTHLIPTTLEQLRGKAWIWHGDGFAKIEQVVLSRKQEIDLKPYVYQLPVEMNEFRNLWSFCQIKEKCSLVEVLMAIKEAHEEMTEIINEDHDLRLSIHILNDIAKSKVDDDLREKLFIPISTEDSKFTMKKFDECTYCDKEWYQHGFSVDDLDDNIFLIHEHVPLSTAEKLNIPSLISKTIGAEELEIGYGQSEPLTRRLKAILRDYTDGLAVLKELIQNADDAGATEIRFLYDERKNEDAQTILLDPNMKGLQGPALCVFNDAVFSDHDFKSIVELSGATKESITEKIGRFGLGFNAVYNLTDVPIFISREFIVFFDPHTIYLGKTIPDKRKPGIKLNLQTHRKKIQRLVDQFHPLNGIFGCELGNDSSMESYKGTLFRFPLRTKEQAIRSEICKICYDREEIVTLMKLLHNAGHDLLMYTQNVQKITVFHLSEDACTPKDMQEWYSIKKDLVKVLRSNGCNKLNTSNIQTQCAVLEQATAILNQYKSNPTAKKPILESSSVLKFSTTREAAVPVDFGTPSSSDVSHWFVVSVLGRGRAFDLALKDKTLIPVGGIAAKLLVQSDGKFQVTTVGNSSDGHGLLYCFLPLPINTVFPVHINGFFAVHSSRTHLYETSPQDKTDRRGVWNEALLDDAITSAYCVLLEDLTRLCPEFDSYMIWPSHITMNEAMFLRRLSESVYKEMCSDSHQLHVVKTRDTTWTTMTHSIMISRQFQDRELRDVAMSTLQMILANNDLHVVDIPENILQTIMQTSSSSFIGSRILSKVQFYGDHLLPNIMKVDAVKRDRLILHALFDDGLAQLLEDIECIPVSPDGRELRSVSELVDPSSQLAELYDAEEGRFPKWTSGVSIDPSVFDRLVVLGMKRDTLPWKEILDRCAVVSSNPKTAVTRTPLIISLADKKLKSTSGKTQKAETSINKIRSMKFVPVMKKPKLYPLKWRGDDYSVNQLISCKDGYLSSDMNLTCCSYPIIDEKLLFGYKCYEIKQRLSLKRTAIDPNVVVQQVLDVVRVGELTTDSDNLKIINEVYDTALKWLDDFLKENNVHSSIKQLASCKSIFLQSNVLLEPRRCALKFPYAIEALLPYLSMVPPAMARSYPVLMKAIGVKEEFCLTDYIQVLKEIKQEASDRVLNKRQLDVSICLIVHCIYDEVKNSMGDYLNLQQEMPMPNADGKMYLVKDLCFNNCLWLADATERLKFSHELIPHEVASKLGLQTIRQGILKQHRLGLPFGQKERLVKRIKTILKEYPFTEDILKEMLQNADDSAAKEIHFICDTRTLKTDKIFEESWIPLQGPAFCVYNDKSFRPSDLKGIQHLGEGGKSGDPTKTGQFGVGFNCVYHLTDVPTFLTTVDKIGTVLCAFDPNCKFVPDALPSDPGALFKDVNTLKDKFPDVFDGYLVNEKKYDVSKTGTFFRFPLRNQETAEQSEISDKPLSLNEVVTMFDKFKSDMSEALLFVNSVEKISLVEVSEGKDSRKPVVRVSYQVTINMTDEARKTRADFRKYVLENSARLAKKEVSLKDIAVKEVSYQMEIKDSENNEDVWWIVQRFGFDGQQPIPNEIVTAVSIGDLGLLPHGGVAYLAKTTRKASRTSRLFCFLPLPVTTELPVHVNGQFSLDHESRRDLWKDEHKSFRAEWNRCLMERIISPAYTKLLCNVRDHIRQLESYDDARFEMERYFKLFPKVDKGDTSYVGKMSKSVYSHIMSMKLDILPLQSMKKDIKAVEWKNPCVETNQRVFFDSLESQHPPEPSTIQTEFYRSSGVIRQETTTPRQETKSSILRKLLVRCGFSMFSCPVRIFKSFPKAGIEVPVVSPDVVIEFFATHANFPTRCTVGNLPEMLSKTRYKDEPSLLALLEYIAKEPNYKMRLDGLPVQLTTDGFVRSFDSRMPVYASRFIELVPHIPNMFINLNIISALRLTFASDLHLCVEFKVEDFAKALPDLITDADFFDSEGSYPVESLEKFLKPHKTGSLHWLLTLWSFLQSFITGLSPIPMQEKESISVLLNPLINCCILPVLENGAELLYPIGKSSAVIPLQSIEDGSNKEISKILHKLGVAEPNYKYIRSMPITSEIIRLTSCIFGGVQQPHSVLKALTLLTRKKSLKDQLDTKECLSLLRYLSLNIDNLKSERDSKNTIRALPLFVNFCDKQINLEDKPVYVLQSSIPSIDMEICMDRQKIIILKSDPSLKSLFEFLQCECMTEEHAYCNLILDHFDSLSLKGQETHMEFVKNHIQSLGHSFNVLLEDSKIKKKQFFERIKTLAFIPKCDQSEARRLFPPSGFYDPENTIFKTILANDKFPPKPYNSREWLSILRECGLVKDLTNEMLLSYAGIVANNAQENITSDLVNRSKALTDYVVVTMSKENPTPEFIEKIKQIKFVVPGSVSKSLEQLHRQFGDRSSNDALQFIAFQDAVLHKHQELVWTVRNLTPSAIDQYTDTGAIKFRKMLEALGVMLDPDVKSAACNAQKLFLSFKKCSLEEKKRNAPVLQEVSTKIFEYLSKLPSMASSVKGILSGTPCVLISETFTLVRPTQIAIDIKSEEEIKPYLYKMPHEFGKYVSFLKKLGATEEFTAAQFALVLNDVAKESCGEKLNPEDFRACRKAMKGLFLLIKSGQSIPEDLFLLCHDGKLHVSSEVVFADNRSVLRRTTEFKQPLLIDAHVMELMPSDVKSSLDRLRQCQKIKFLSEIVQEVVTPGEAVPCTFAEKMTERLRNPVFKNGFERIIRHCFSLPANSAKVRNLDQQCSELVSALNRIGFVGRNKVQTHLVYDGTRIENSEIEVDFFCENTSVDGQNFCKFYVRSTANIYLADFSEMLANAINKLTLEVPTICMLQLAGIISRPISDLYRYLDSHQIKESGNDAASSFRPIPGTPIPIGSLHLLIQDDFVFYRHQLVALELDDPFDRKEKGLPTLILVEVLERLEPEDACSPIMSARYRVRLDLDGGEQTVHASSLYAFARRNEHPELRQTAIVIYIARENAEGEEQQHTAKNPGEREEFKQRTLEDIIEEIKKLLTESWRQSSEVMNKVIRRLWVKWHPDKNPGQETLCTKVVQIMQNLIKQLKDGKSIDDYNVSNDRDESSSASSSGASPRDDDFDDFFDRMRDRARFYDRQREHYTRDSSSRGTGDYYHSQHDYENFFRGFTHQPNPQPEEARRWMRQASHDLQSAVNDGASGSCPSFDWMCIKCHEAAKIAVKAVQYASDSNKLSGSTDSLTSLGHSLNDSEISRLCRELESVIISSSHLKHPSHHGFPKVPFDFYQEDKASEAFQISSKILKRCSQLIDSMASE